MNKGLISYFLRRYGLLYPVDKVRYYLQKWGNRKANNQFRHENPNVQLPPDYLMYESFRLDYRKYYNGSFETAKWLVQLLSEYIEFKNIRILDWGCGPGRIIRHIPELTGNKCKYYGVDYNRKSIDWCSENLEGISFHNNSLTPDLPFPDEYFDVIYGISVLTHLSGRSHHEWYYELRRIVKQNGIILLTTQGDNFKGKLTATELKRYDNNLLIVRGKVKEGHRTYSAFHPAGYMTELFKKDEILKHHISEPLKKGYIPQDIWIVRKR